MFSRLFPSSGTAQPQGCSQHCWSNIGSCTRYLSLLGGQRQCGFKAQGFAHMTGASEIEPQTLGSLLQLINRLTIRSYTGTGTTWANKFNIFGTNHTTRAGSIARPATAVQCTANVPSPAPSPKHTHTHTLTHTHPSHTHTPSHTHPHTHTQRHTSFLSNPICDRSVYYYWRTWYEFC